MKKIKFKIMLMMSMLVVLSYQAQSTILNQKNDSYPFWGAYHKTPINKIKPAKWIETDNVIEGWDWSMPPHITPAANTSLCVARNFILSNTNAIKQLPKVNFPTNPVISHWVKWRELEPEEGNIDFSVLKKNIQLAASKGYGSIVRMHFSATDFAPEWITKYNIPIRKEHKENPKKTNYEVSHPEFHSRYLKVIKAFGESEIPQMAEVKGMFVGYASPSNGDEGIGPHGVDPDTVKHVLERLDVWAEATRNVEHKVFMGGISNYGLDKGFGIRRGFVEMYLYHIPDATIGQKLDNRNYLYVNQENPIIANNLFQGEENEEYEEAWATKARGFRFGRTTESFPYRYFTANLRLLQMRCNYVLNNEFALLPEMLAWVSLEMGRTVEDAPDAWCFLRESYIKRGGGQPVKNFERWIYQRDAPGFETEPVMKIEHPIKMWMVQTDKYYDYIARAGKRIGFNIDDKWKGQNNKMAIKVSYIDTHPGAMKLTFQDGDGLLYKKQNLTGDGQLKTVTFMVSGLKQNSLEYNFDFVLEAEEKASEIVVSMVRAVAL